LVHSLRVDMMLKRCEVSVTIAFRVAKVLDASIYDVITGTALPPGTCKHCGRSSAGVDLLMGQITADVVCQI
jgi:hypothetical protein